LTVTSDVAGTPSKRLYVPVLFTLTIFTSALLLFFVQPLFTRLVLPQIGGAAAVWTTAMLFFQTVLIGGYVYAHLLTRHLSVRNQIITHLTLLCLAMLFLPLAVPESWSYDANRPVVTQTLWLYALGVGLPFGVLSANAPLIQSWYRRSGGPNADDPYFLYSASNLGSLVALLAFPLVAEPLVGISAIAIGWSVGFVALGGLLLMAGLAARGPLVQDVVVANHAAASRPSLRVLGIWAFLAFIPSSLMLGVTSKISMDIGSFPLVWVLPLALYLLTFVVVFSAKARLTGGWLGLGFPVALALLVFLTFKPSGSWTSFTLLLASFFYVSLFAHRLLFEARPDARYLTVFYITMSVGGALGGIFNSIVAPLAFNRLDELVITIALSSVLFLSGRGLKSPRDVALGVLAVVPVMLPLVDVIPAFATGSVVMRTGLASLILLGATMAFRHRPLAATTVVVLMLGLWTMVSRQDVVLEARSFFGPHIVKDTAGKRIYSNGTTVHGAEFLADFGGRPRPLSYYHRDGAMAEVLASDRGKAAKTIGIVGLGVGSLACYGQPGQDWHFYEIDKKVVDIALDPTLFTFMSECGKEAEIHLGDARIVLERQTDIRYDILIIDAYSSDAVPVHLATQEALALYRDRLAPGGLLLFHISNRFYDLSQPLAAATDALGMQSRIKQHTPDAAGVADGDVVSTVMIMAEDAAALGAIATDATWSSLDQADSQPWTDDHSDLLSAMR
jgi:hypothetical protein